MTTLLYDFLPVLLFFIAFKYYGIYVATVVGIGVTALQVAVTALWLRRIDKKQLLTLVVFVLFGGLTLYFHNPIFIKWKPTVVFWIFGLVFLGSHFVGKKPLIQRMLEGMLEKQSGSVDVPMAIWKKLNIAWTIFFILLGFVNLYVAYTFTTDVWVNFKLYGILSMLMLFSFLQAMCLTRYCSELK
jgi:intracellular septation protein